MKNYLVRESCVHRSRMLIGCTSNQIIGHVIVPQREWVVHHFMQFYGIGSSSVIGFEVGHVLSHKHFVELVS